MFFESGVSIFNTPIQRIRPVGNAGVTRHMAPVRSHHVERNCRPKNPSVSARVLFHSAENKTGECPPEGFLHRRFEKVVEPDVHLS